MVFFEYHAISINSINIIKCTFSIMSNIPHHPHTSQSKGKNTKQHLSQSIKFTTFI